MYKHIIDNEFRRNYYESDVNCAGPLNSITEQYAFFPEWFGSYGFLKRRVRYAIVSATARYPIMAIKLPIVEAMKGW